MHMGRAAVATLSTENLLHNLSVIKRHAPCTKIIAMVKANAYGHGLRSVSRRLAPHVDSLGVASIDEALALRRVGVTIPITLMQGVFQADELPIASAEGFHVVFHDIPQLRWLRAAALPSPLRAWLKIDTGMGRLGFSIEAAEAAYQTLSQHSQIVQPIGITSHFACADDAQHPLNTQQIATFQRFVAGLPGPKSLCNSAGIFSFTHHHYDVVRPGIALYGISPIPGISAEALDLKPVMTLHTRLIAVRMARKGTSLGYGARYICPEDMPVGVIAMGYGDGLPRTARDGTPLLVNGVRCQIVGRVSMDMTTIDLRACPTAQVNDPVVLWGEGLPIEAVAQCTSNSPYDMVTALQSRVTCIWND